MVELKYFHDMSQITWFGKIATKINMDSGGPGQKRLFTDIWIVGDLHCGFARVKCKKMGQIVQTQVAGNWFKKQGSGYQTRINSLLMAYKEAHHNKSGRSCI
jgi:hypothetical protein